MASRGRVSAQDASRGYRFIQAPPRASMRRQSPGSAPRLYEWLLENEYVEPVSFFKFTPALKRPKLARRKRSRR